MDDEPLPKGLISRLRDRAECGSADRDILMEAADGLARLMKSYGRAVFARQSVDDIEVTQGELLPCPFCGGDAGFREGHANHWRVACTNCGLHHPHLVVRERDPKPELVAAWNTRHRTAAIAGERVQRDDAWAALRRIAEGNLGDAPWQANYETIRTVARNALPPAALSAPIAEGDAALDRLRSAVDSFIDALTSGGNNPENTLSINHDVLNACIKDGRAALKDRQP